MAENQEEVVDVQEEVVTEQAQEPDMLDKEHVNKLVMRAKADAAEKARREAQAEYQRELERVRASQSQGQNQTQEPIDQEALYQQFREKMAREEHEARIKQDMEEVAKRYYQAVEDGKKSYEDFGDVTADFDPDQFKELVVLVSQLENAGDIIYTLGKHPLKLAEIDNLIHKAPRMAYKELQKMSSSLKSNQDALEESRQNGVNPPLDSLQASNVSTGNGKRTISDLRKQPWLRG